MDSTQSRDTIVGYIFDALKRSEGNDDHGQPDAREGVERPAVPPPAQDTAPANEPRATGPFSTIFEDADLTDGLDGKTQQAYAFTETPQSQTTDQETEIEDDFAPLGAIGADDHQAVTRFDDRVVVATEPSSRASEEYRLIRTSLLARWEQRRNLVHTITSATPQEGKTITSLNLGLSLAELHERRTIVIEADLRLPSFEDMLHIGSTTGLLAYLRNQATAEQIIETVPGSNLSVITAGGRAGRNAVSLLGSGRMKSLLSMLRTRYDHIIIDTPPALDLADAGILGGFSDEVLLVARMRLTPRPLIEQAVRVLRSYHTPIGGVIATDQEEVTAAYSYAYSYRYRYVDQLREAA